MKDTRLVAILDVLSDKELRRLKKWLESPYYNTRTDVSVLLDVCVSAKQKDDDFPNKKEIFQLLYPKQVYDDNKMRNVISSLNKQVEKFILTEKKAEDTRRDDILILKIFKKRFLNKHHLLRQKKIEKSLGKTILKDRAYFKDSFLYFSERYEFSVLKDRSSPESLQLLHDNLDISYMAEKLWQSINILSHELVFKKKYQQGLLPAVIKEIKEREELMNVPLLKVLLSCYEMVSQPKNDSKYEELKTLVYEHVETLDKEVLYGMIQMLAGKCIRRFNEGDRTAALEVQFYKEEFFRLGLSDQMNHFGFRSAIHSGIVNRKFDFVEDILENYIHQMDPEWQLPIKRWGEAYLAFAKKDFEMTLEKLRDVKFDDLAHNIAVRLLLSKALYELKEFDVLENHLKAFEVFIRRRKESINHLRWVYPTIAYMRKLMNVRKGDTVAKERILEELVNNTVKLDVKWLREKTKEL